MAQQALFTPNRALDANAYAQPGATATFYASGTMTLIDVFSDKDGTVPTTNPVVADGNGVFPQSFVEVDAKVIVRDADGATLWTVDPCPATSGDVTGASNVSFSPTVAVPETNVQAAIESVAASVLTGASDFGLGITGNAPTISNIDSTSQASGVFRFTGTTTGTFPSGITASTTGLVRIDRQTAAEAVMFLRAAGQSRLYVRYLVASTWGAWQEDIVLAPPAADRIPFWDQSATKYDFLVPDSSIAISGTSLAVAAPARAWVRFNGVPAAGTYSRTGTLVTVTLTGHGMTTGQGVSLDFTTGAATDGFYTITVVDANTFTVTDSASGSTSGNVTRNVHVRASFNVSSVTRAAAGGDYTINFATAMSDANYCAVVTVGGGGTLSTGNALVGWAAIYNTTSVQIGVSDNNSDSNTDSFQTNVTIFR